MIHLQEYKCKRCGKEIYPTLSWRYKRDNRYYCSWKCFNNPDQIKQRKIIRPNVGDTIRIHRVHPQINGYKNKVGVVEFIDSFGQLYGTWGKLQLVPETDEFEIIKEREINDEQTET